LKCINFYYWSQNSHIPWHNDHLHVGGITIYLNESWDTDSGGLFLFENNDLVQGIYPQRNLCIQQQGNVSHSVSPSSSQSQIRTTIQIFY
jgi:Rps23 Pro-64 3,4-dihydroxylase Tpa1-like proline 4-hydroxylase